MRNSLKSLDETGAQLLAVDPHESWSAKYLLKEAGVSTDDVNFPVLMDPSLTASVAYGVAFQMRIHTERSNRPATFVIDKEGVIRYAKRGETFADRPKPSDIVDVLKGLGK